jgi:protein-S-isoprenylcysteine O-methyltransferase Ste14
MWLISLFLPGYNSPVSFRIIASVTLVAIGAFYSITGVISFRKAKTSVNPLRPDITSKLVKDGIYKYTRNPMYMGFLFFLVGWGFILSNIYSMALCIGFILYMNRFQIQPEEKALMTIFGEDFINYKNRVRRWL